MKQRGRMVSGKGNPQGGLKRDAARIGNGGKSVEYHLITDGRWYEAYISPSEEIIELILENHNGVSAILASGRKIENVTVIDILD